MFDYQKVRLVGITKPVNDDVNSASDLISYCARVSNPSNQTNFETSDKLLKYCINHKHWSIFETVSVVMEIETTRDIGRQILRHRSFSFQEFSQRYAEKLDRFPTDDYRECRLQDTKNRQNSLVNNNDMLAANWLAQQIKVENAAKAAYEWAIKAGIAKEVARAVLPEGLTMSRMYMSGTLRSWIHFIEVRTDISTQSEHRDIANKAMEILKNEFDFLKEYLVNES